MLSRDVFFDLVNHVFLPPKLPQKNDTACGVGDALLDTVVEALEIYLGFFKDSQLVTVEMMIDMLSNLKKVHSLSTDAVMEDQLRDALQNVVDHGGFLPLHIHAQNAGVIIRKVDKNIHFETFELAPLNKAVMTTKGRLIRHFPASATSVELCQAAEVDFQTVIAHTLSLMSHQSVPGLQPQVKKAGQMHDEDRDTTDPDMVTGFFNGFVTALGTYVDVEVIAKNTREEVLWSDARFPWRRSPFWLFLRVSLQLGFSQSAKANDGPKLYKQFILFFVSHVLQKSAKHPIETDLLYVMTAKLTRRLLKTGTDINPLVLESVRKATCQAHKRMTSRWLEVQHSGARTVDMMQLSALNFNRDTRLDLDGLDKFIESLQSRQPQSRNSDFRPVQKLITYHAHVLPDLASHTVEGSVVVQNLHGFETWVGTYLSTWAEEHGNDLAACGQLAQLMRRYHHLATPHYSGNAEATSVMILVMLELWTACDKMAIATCPLLDDYEPGISKNLLQSLLLPLRRQMERLMAVEDYIVDRTGYFDESADHQALRQRVIDRAAAARISKLNELRRVKDEYAGLMRLYHQTSCDVYERITNYSSGLTEEYHPTTCARCQYKTQADRLSIEVFEWPLPANDAKVKTVIFELCVPAWFAHWRDSTMELRLNVLGAEYTDTQQPRSSHRLSEDPHLAHAFFSPPHDAYPQRVGLLSQNKPHIGTHRRGRVVSTATERDVCLQSGLTYQYYDSSRSMFLAPVVYTEKLPRSCTYVLPGRSKALQKYIFRPARLPNGPPPNAVIANQSECPDHMSLHEFKELASIPLAYRLQWMDIAVQLGHPSIDFKKPETALVLLQCIYQTGPRHGQEGTLRESHQLLSTNEFPAVLIENLDAALKRVEQNWESSQALAVFIAVARRLLSLSSSNEIKDACLRYLERASAVSLGWAHLLKNKAHEADATDREQLLARSVEAALTCASSFDVERVHLPTILAVPTAASAFVQCCIIVFDGRHSLEATNSTQTQLLHSRHQRLLYDARHIIAADHEGLHDAIAKSWSAYRPAQHWHISESSDHWTATCTTTTARDDGLMVHYNLISGELLVNGEPLDRLPSEYEEHSSYQVLFGKSAVEVMPSNVAGMRFSSKREHRGCEVHFGLTTSQGPVSKELMMQIFDRKSRAKFEFIPARLFREHFPDSFVDDFIHWYDYATGNVEFRPVAAAWNAQATEKWVLSRYNGILDNGKKRDDSKWALMLPRNGSLLVSMKSETATLLASILAPLAQPRSIHCVAGSSSTFLDVNLPTLRLSFHLIQNETTLRCREFRGMIVDPDQTLGTLVGFRNKLMLREEHDDVRKIIVIEGRTCVKTSHRIPCNGDDTGLYYSKTSVSRQTVTRWHSFDVDTCLERLVDNGSTQSKLFLAYLHALTSYCLPDPLTKRTGTEQAISILSSAAVRSFDQLSDENIDLLSRIAELTPKRAYYPRNERVMQTFSWRTELGFMAQHPRFYQIATSLLHDAKRYQVLYPNSEVDLPTIRDVEPLLLQRECIRSSVWRIFGYGAEDYTREHDVTYQSRDRNARTNRQRSAYEFCSLVHNGRSTLHSRPPSATCLWDFLCRATEVSGPQRPVDLSQVKYDGMLLQDRGSFLSGNWPALHRVLSGQQRPSVNKYGLMIWLSAMACSGLIEKAILETVVLLYNCDELKVVTPPSLPSFQVAEGRSVSKARLEKEIHLHLQAFHNSPDAKLAQVQGESRKQYGKRQQELFKSHRHLAVDRLVSFLRDQWPTPHPSRPSAGSAHDESSYVDMEGTMAAVKIIFKTRFDNRQLFSYLQTVVETISGFETSQRPAPRLLKCCEPIQPMSMNINETTQPQQLETFVAELSEGVNSSQYERKYVERLKASLDSLRRLSRRESGQVPSLSYLDAHLTCCRLQMQQMFDAMTAAVNPVSAYPWIESTVESRQWPRICPMLFLEQLGRDGWARLTDEWKECVTSYGLALGLVQKAKRMVIASRAGRSSDVVAEIQNTGHRNWDPLQYPESLLLEVESNIMIRDVQEEIAREMRSPESRQNTSMQLNMGEGKSSVIVPMVAAALANGAQLVRVVVGKPQAKQTAQMLISKLGGMLNRQIYHLPNSRSLKLDKAGAEEVDRISRECMAGGGILLMQPEHILSFQLMGLERYSLGDDSVGRSLVQTQRFFDERSRDIVDESDENFSVKFELIYTMGLQRSIDMSPDRWSCIHQILDVVNAAAISVIDSVPSSLEIQQTFAGRFPRIRLHAVGPLVDIVGQKICDTGLPGFPIATQPQSVQDAVLAYMTKPDVTNEEIGLVENAGPGGFFTESIRPTLFLLRGLLAGGVLGFVFGRKRWRVNYGLDTSRTPPTRLAVPYRAKDMPTSRSEFSHPDVVILLTSLCYYYGGLTDDHLFASFAHLLDTDQRDVEFQTWIQGVPELPPTFRQLEGINLKDRAQCKSLVFPALRFNKRVVDYFLSHIVFPKEMKEFPYKFFTPPPRVILDVGAQILEMNNQEVARTWLSMHATENTRGVVFFNDNDEIVVMNREGFVEPLQTSAFANQLETCLVFLDEAHTRGTDLRLPQDYRAAVTLGANLTKDRLVQGECIGENKSGQN
ncbi:hypothetical protein M409DRAFT_71485 [Zasmidium cellare ATCC 36951]|uniref:ubiquitinyl hydrolase 1 n=1 Tax=Zasmidium cellare ATCC 36951 TaxID=1080233 RepID=A0A6A6BXF9_ZASCE|nr:uncharacterized protein M409DRAFT_71485 [Zasmidium cellare ATCC 36951]KAF2158728.1 hypothetical protein M409DRAFT_71485 [Zasmidium cellare ATCC 36951]